MENEPQKLVINEREISLIKSVFKDNDVLLKSMRALLLGLPVSTEEKKHIKKTFANEELMRIMWTRFYPQLDRNTPMGQVNDVWLGVESMVFGFPKDTIKQAIQYKAEALAMTQIALGLLEDPTGEVVDVTYNPKEDDDLALGLLSRNLYVRHIESQLLHLKTIANAEEKSDEQRAKDNAMDSSR